MTRITALANHRGAANSSDETAKIFDSQRPTRAFRFATKRPRDLKPAPPIVNQPLRCATVQAKSAEEAQAERLEGYRLRYLDFCWNECHKKWAARKKHLLLTAMRNHAVAKMDPEVTKESLYSELTSYGSLYTTNGAERSSLAMDLTASTASTEPVRGRSRFRPGEEPVKRAKKISEIIHDEPLHHEEMDERKTAVEPATQTLDEPTESTLLITATATFFNAVKAVKPAAKSIWAKAKVLVQDVCTWTGNTFQRKHRQWQYNNAENMKDVFDTTVFKMMYPWWPKPPKPEVFTAPPVKQQAVRPKAPLPPKAPPHAAPVVDSRDDTTEDDSRVDLDLSVLQGFPAFHPPEPANRPAYYQKRRAMNFDEFQKFGYGT